MLSHYPIATHIFSFYPFFLSCNHTPLLLFLCPTYPPTHTHIPSFHFLPYLSYHTFTKFPLLFFIHPFFFFYHVFTRTLLFSHHSWVMGHNGPKLILKSMLGKYIDVPMLSECNQWNPNTLIGTRPCIKKLTKCITLM